MITNLRVKENAEKNQEQATSVMLCNLEEIKDLGQREKVSQLVSEFDTMFSKGDNDLGRTSLVSHEINTEGANPVYQRAYRVPYASQGELNRQLDVMIENDIIEEANSPWAASLLLIDKKDGTKKLVIDFRRLNKVTRKDR